MQRVALRYFLILSLLCGLAASHRLLAQPSQAPAEAAAPSLAYRAELQPGEAGLEAALRDASQLVALQESAPTGVGGILGRATADRDRLARALQSAGYWAGRVEITLAGESLGSPGLAERLETAQAPVLVVIKAEPGPLFTIAMVSVRPGSSEGAEALASAAAEPFGLAEGDTAAAAPVLAAEATLLDRLRRAGHPLAAVAARETTVDFTRRTMDVVWRIAPGPFARFGQPVVEGQQRVDTAFLNRVAGRIAGQPFSPERLDRARRDLQALGVFDAVRARTAEQLDAQGNLPATFTVSERPRRALGASAAYETNYGPSVRVYWEHRNLFGGAENLRLEAEVARIGVGNGIGGMTYRVGGTLRDPGILGRDLTLVTSLFGLRERLDAYDRDAVTFAALIEKRYSERLSATAGPVGEFGQIGPSGGPLRAYQIVGFQVGGKFDTSDSLLDPSRGYRLQGSITPSYSLRDGTPFAPLRVTGTTYWDIGGDRRSILALRASYGSLFSPGRFQVPENQRFYAGGGGSIRGFDYQSVGPRRANGKPAGGASLAEASIELRQRLWGNFGMAAFVDAGTVGSGLAPDFSNLRVGAGLGIRYYTPIGPIRADVAVPLVRQQGSSGYGLYVGIGQAF